MKKRHLISRLDRKTRYIEQLRTMLREQKFAHLEEMESLRRELIAAEDEVIVACIEASNLADELNTELLFSRNLRSSYEGACKRVWDLEERLNLADESKTEYQRLWWKTAGEILNLQNELGLIAQVEEKNRWDTERDNRNLTIENLTLKTRVAELTNFLERARRELPGLDQLLPDEFPF